MAISDDLCWLDCRSYCSTFRMEKKYAMGLDPRGHFSLLAIKLENNPQLWQLASFSSSSSSASRSFPFTPLSPAARLLSKPSKQWRRKKNIQKDFRWRWCLPAKRKSENRRYDYDLDRDPFLLLPYPLFFPVYVCAKCLGLCIPSCRIIWSDRNSSLIFREKEIVAVSPKDCQARIARKS